MNRQRDGVSYFEKVFFIILIIVLMCCLSALFSSYSVMSDYAEKQIAIECEESVRSVSDTMTVMANGLARDALHLTLLINQTTSGNISAQTFLSRGTQGILLRRNLYNHLVHIARANAGFQSVYLYLSDLNYVISSNSEFAYAEKFSDRAWLEAYRESDEENEMWMGVRTVYPYQSNTPTYVMTYIYPLSTYIAPNVRGLVVFNILESEILSILNASGIESTAIVNRSGEVACNGIGTEITECVNGLQDVKSKVNEEGGSFVRKFNDEDFVVSYAQMEICRDWWVVRLSSLHDMISLRDRSLRIMALAMSTVFLFCGVLVWILAKRLSLPIMRLREQLEADERFRNTGPDDIHRIEKAMLYLQQEEKRLSREVEKRSWEHRQRYAESLLLSEGEEDEDPTLTEMCGECEQITLYMSNDNAISRLTHCHGEDLKQYQSLAAGLCIDALAMQDAQYTILYINRDTLIVCHRLPQDGGYEEIVDALRTFQENCEKTLGFSYSIGISKPWRTTVKAHNSYLEARNAARMKLLRGYRCIVMATEIPEDQAHFFYPFMQERQLTNAISSGNGPMVMAAVREFIQTLRSKIDITVDNAMLALHLFAGTVVRILNEKGRTDGISIPEVTVILDRLFFRPMATLDEVEDFFQEQLGSAMQRLMSRKPAEDGTVKRICRYIDENYQNDLSIEDVAAQLEISYSYARKVFKESMQCSILDYLNDKRLAEAKKLLQETNMTIREIALAVGCNNEQSLCRIFKKREGILPSHYRLSVRNGKR